MPGVASALRISSQFTSFRNLLPRSRNSGVFSVPFTCKGKVCDSSQRIPLPVGQPAARQTSPAVRATRPQPPELARPGDDAARPACIRLRSASSLAGWGRAVLSLTTRRKGSRHRVDSGKDRPRHDASAARVHAAEILIRAQRPPAAPSVNISLRVLAFGQSP